MYFFTKKSLQQNFYKFPFKVLNTIAKKGDRITFEVPFRILLLDKLFKFIG